ncbi:hypothetical protein J31TS4_25020 [Paenibacillus sp. J31TS4]|uniref:SpoIID/LytB domain-containing protein n=1 Tax=Paenibacillus sp. J31TS4 TaxID=2807195 RepID=UPI001B161A62|nr:SpoIID/LytB domain-containing protein [Paenibacillus sp. J31TS4]GIP39222.1 hypothetical protein J31TS4_25020 [Paenibacillus sp. J31TS4]
MKIQVKKKTWAAVLAAGMLLGASVPYAPSTAYAAVPKLDAIRVGLYLETSNAHTSIPAVSLSADKGLTAGLRSAAGTKPMLEAAAGKIVRGSADQFGVRLLETPDYAKAKSLADKLTTAGYKPAVLLSPKAGSNQYHVVLEGYADAAAAQSALAAVKANATLAGAIASPAVTGTLRLNAGSYATEAEAAVQLNGIRQVGLTGDLAIQENADGTLVYSVWVGNETDQKGLDALKAQAAAAAPNAVFQPADVTRPYLLVRSDRTTGQTADVTRLSFPSGAKVWVAPKASSKIKVVEKGDRTYSGGIELSVHNGKMAVINELPFEQYLYSVVSSEMSTGWPQEALKAQAVAARSYALQKGLEYEIAHVVDSVVNQAYSGKEYPDVIQAVDATKGQVLVTAKGAVFSPLFHSNAGGMTADSPEVWGNANANYRPVTSPDDVVLRSRADWMRIVLPSGTTGYVPAANVKELADRSAIGLPYVQAAETVSVLKYPELNKAPAVGTLTKGEKVVTLEKVKANNEYSWRVVSSADELRTAINKVLASPVSGLASLEVVKKGASGRVTALKVNGETVAPKQPDSFRTMLGGLRSTLFEIEQNGRYTVMGAGGVSRDVANATAGYVTGAASAPVKQGGMFLMDASGQVRPISDKTEFTFRGQGYGHGLGMSQWGARSLAEQGYDYAAILQYYYTGVTLAKD